LAVVLGIGVVVAVAMTPGASPTRAQQSAAELSLAPTPAPLATGQRATYTVVIKGAERLFGADLELSFDPGAAAIVDADPAKDGVQARIGPLLDPGFVVYNVADNRAGKLRVTFTQVAPKAAVSGDGGIVSFDVEATGGGDPKLRISAALLARDDGLAQPVIIAASGATPVAPQGSPIPNPTPMPEESLESPTTQTSPTIGTGDSPTTPTVAVAATASDNGGNGWGLAAIVVGALAVLGGAALIANRYLRRTGVQQ